MTVGFVIVSHSAKLAEGVVELASQMTQGRVPLIAAGGTNDGSLGTSLERVQEAIAKADQGDGVIILFDLGSALLTTEMALEGLTSEGSAIVQISGAPLVEGAVAAAVQASLGEPLQAVLAAAQDAITTPKLAAEAEMTGGAPIDSESATVVLLNRVGLHARPASLFVQTAGRFVAQISVSLGDHIADGKRILSILRLGARCGDTLVIQAHGPGASPALAALVALVQRKFDEE